MAVVRGSVDKLLSKAVILAKDVGFSSLAKDYVRSRPTRLSCAKGFESRRAWPCPWPARSAHNPPRLAMGSISAWISMLGPPFPSVLEMVLRKLAHGRWRVYSRKLHQGHRLNLGTFDSKVEALKRERQLARFGRS